MIARSLGFFIGALVEKRFTAVASACHGPLVMSDLCKIQEIRIPCFIGVDDWEAKTLQTLVIDLHFPISATTAAATDCIQHTIDYRVVADGLFATFEGKRIQLIETFAEQIANWVLTHTPVMWIDVIITKDISKTAAQTAVVQIHRERP
ncbi:MAG: bifunctional dihydroneopterin aldolase/7,8-dihydroneopterin epimerase [Deltaproteobacteria bacterium CG11_big_fil_rev_8_21_14_0_20_47_16]|nr:MAG: bifunctional dihydroneopterin aldolase/7,8-dihydroneopterin epimerase [Deltaproteobacteria bacterium CG11_big_fil_rev_8_21_14_0_20_47_16]